MHIYFWLLVFGIIINHNILAQELTLKYYLETIKKFHPISQQANLLTREGELQLTNARGNFDPKLNSDYQQKEYAEKLYYKIWNSELSVPVIGPLDIYTNYSQTEGYFLNPENTTATNGLFQLGAKIDVLQGLLNNKRQIDIQKAKNFKKLTQIEQQNILNQLFFEATEAYLQWARDYSLLANQKKFLEIAKDRYNNVKKSAELGEYAPIDTLEALIQLQNRYADLNDASIKYIESTLNMSNFLWSEQNTPYIVDINNFPEQLDKINLNIEIPEDWLDRHPELLKIKNKITDLNLDKQLKIQYLLPKLNLKYSLLSANTGNQLINQFNTNNYTIGFNFSYPLFLRKERTELQLTKLKIRHTELYFADKANQITNKVKALEQAQAIIEEQLKLYQAVTQNTQTLFDAEKAKFNIGESSLFLIIAREINFFNANLKLITWQYKQKENLLKIVLAKGIQVWQ